MVLLISWSLLVDQLVLSFVLFEAETPFVVPGQYLKDHCMGPVLEDLDSQMEALHMDEGDQEALEVQDIPLAVQELLSDKTFL